MEKSINPVGTTTYQRIKRDIISGELEPSSKLKLDGLRDRYAASMSTLRETLNRLASEGFVVARDQRGFFVADVSREDLIEIANLRVLLECHALRLSVERGDTDWEGNVVAAHHKLRLMEEKLLTGDTGDKKNWKRYDREFHLTLIQACGSGNLLSLHAVLFDKYLRYQNLVLTFRGRVAADEHRKMFEAALNRDAESAARVLQVHIEHGLEHALAAFN